MEEKVFRSTSMFLLSQYFCNRKNGAIPADLGGLVAIYHNVHTVNKYTCRRLRGISKSDCPVNAIVILDMFTLAIHSAVKHDLKELQSYFNVCVDDFVFPSTNHNEEVREDEG